MKKTREDLFAELAAGSAAGLCVDIVLFPLDTVKTRLQSAQGFIKAGGFAGIYRGIGSTAVGSVPGAAIFFGTYETVKSLTLHSSTSHWKPLDYMLAACCGETMACMVRVPTEVVKQRAMTSQARLSSFGVLLKTIQSEGFFGLYRGYISTVFREIPFSLLQFPIWETLKTMWSERQGSPVQPWQSSVCGAVSGGFSAALTTPLDVAKTRIMLAEVGSNAARGNVWHTLLDVRRQKGFTGLFAGVVPRVLWISLGGAIFLGIYDKVRLMITTSQDRDRNS